MAHAPICYPAGLPGPSLHSSIPEGQPIRVLVYGIIPSQVQDFAFPYIELCRVPVIPFLQPVKVPPWSSLTLWSIYHFSLISVVCKLGEGAHCPVIQILNLVSAGPLSEGFLNFINTDCYRIGWVARTTGLNQIAQGIVLLRFVPPLRMEIPPPHRAIRKRRSKMG